MKKRIALLAGTAAILGMSQSAFPEETGGIQRFAELIEEAEQIREGTLVLSSSLTSGDEELSSGIAVSLTPEGSSVDMLYFSMPREDGTTFDLVTEDVLRIFGNTAYLNTELLEEAADALTEEDLDTDSLSAEELPAEADVFSSYEWVGLTGPDKKTVKFPENWTSLFSGLEIGRDAGSYQFHLDNEWIGRILTRLDQEIEAGTFEQTGGCELDDVLGRYADAVIAGMQSMDPQSVTKDQEEAIHERFQIGLKDLLQSGAETPSLSETFEEAVSKGLVVSASVYAGKDGAAGTYAFELTIQADIPEELQKEWKLDYAEEEIRSVMFSFLVSIEPTEEPAEIEEPEPDTVIWLEELLQSWAAEGYFDFILGE